MAPLRQFAESLPAYSFEASPRRSFSQNKKEADCEARLFFSSSSMQCL